MLRAARLAAPLLVLLVVCSSGASLGGSSRSGVILSRHRAAQQPAPTALARRASPPALLALRGGGRLGYLTPEVMIYLNAASGVLYSLSLLGLDPMLPDPTMKYWQQPQTPATKGILQFFSLVRAHAHRAPPPPPPAPHAPRPLLLRRSCGPTASCSTR